MGAPLGAIPERPLSIDITPGALTTSGPQATRSAQRVLPSITAAATSSALLTTQFTVRRLCRDQRNLRADNVKACRGAVVAVVRRNKTSSDIWKGVDEGYVPVLSNALT